MTTGSDLGIDVETLAPASSAVREIARTDPQRAALELAEGRRISFADLDRSVDQLAQRLLDDHGVDHPMIAMRLTDPLAMTVATLAVQRAGMVGVPIDPTAPIDRVRAVLGEIDPRLILSDVDGDAAALDVPVEHPQHYLADPPPGGVVADRGETASVLFTSGSTGTPKGIVMSSRQRAQASRVFLQLAAEYDLGELRVGAIVVGTVGNADGLIHIALTMGATIIPYEIRSRGLADFGDWLVKERITVTTLVPTIWRFLAPELPADLVFPDLRFVALSGETSTWEDIASLRPHLHDDAIVSNMFGLTEVLISRFDITADMALGTGPLPAGRPLPERTVRIVDDAGEPVAPGASGEIVVECSDCAVGYWQLPEATARVFRPLPDGRTSVRTGDGGRLLADGTLLHLGRLDHVVKVAGNRIELGDVETVLRALPGVGNAAVTTYQSSKGDTRLVGFVVPEPGVSLHTTLLRSALARRLPGSMVPDAIHLLDEMPQLPGGKIDRHALPDRAGVRPEDTRLVAPTNELERTLVEIWREVLGLDEIGIHDDFFGFGGDSLRAAQLFAFIEHRLGVDCPVALILEAPTVSMLAAVLAQGASGWESVVPLKISGSRPPLIVVHDGKGDVFYAQRLVPHLGDDQPVYGLLAESPEVDDSTAASVEEIAASYIERIRGPRPSGPYLLYGYSLGGTIAFEMARQLIAAGEEVLLVGLGDSIGPNHPGVLSRRRLMTVQAKRRLKAMQSMSRTEAVRHVLGGAARRARRRLGLGTSSRPSGQPPAPEAAEHQRSSYDELTGASEAFFNWYAGLSVKYVPASTLNCDVLLIRAFDYDHREDRGWKPYVNGRITTMDVFDEHDRLHAPENTEAVGKAIRRAIDDALRQPATIR